MAIYEASASRNSSYFTTVMDFLLGGSSRLLYGTAHYSPPSDPFARMMLPRTTQHHRKSAIRTVSLWVCFAVLAVVYSKRNTSLDIWKSILSPEASRKGKKKQRGDSSPLQTASDTLQSLCRAFLRYALERLQTTTTEHDLTPTQHRGSCHCGSVKFVVFAPKTLYTVQDGHSRIVTYRHARINTTALTWEEGKVRTYDQSHFFCPVCGVHLAHATASTEETIQLFINVDCLDGQSYILRPVSSRPENCNVEEDERSGNVPLTIPAERVKESISKQSYSPSVSAFDDDVAELSTVADDRIVLPMTSSASVVSAAPSTEELATTAYRLRKALSSHSSSKSTVQSAGNEFEPLADAGASPTSTDPDLAVAASGESAVADADTLRRYLTKHATS